MEQHAYETTSELDARRRARVEPDLEPSERTALAAFFGCAALLVVLVVIAVKAGDVRERHGPRRGDVLVTGFLNFDHVENPSMVAARRLNGTVTASGTRVSSRLLPVSPAGASWTAAELTAGATFAAVIHLGLEESTETLRVEIAGRNEVGKGNNGSCETSPALPGAPCLLATTAPLERLALLPNETWSTSAGRFFCNEAYYRTLAAIRGVRDTPPLTGARGLVPAVFIHLPAETTAPVDLYLHRLRELIGAVSGGGYALHRPDEPRRHPQLWGP